ncbi:MAG: ComF family protein [Planctomycetes bacterium]|nr:ComF family protein [Planctomycetota bacterium]
MNVTRRLSSRFREIRGALADAIDLVYPPVCLACEAIDDVAAVGLCETCRRSLAKIVPPACPRCGEPLRRAPDRTMGKRLRCNACPKGGFAADGAIAALRYVGTAKDLVLGLKFGRDRLLARPLGRLLLERLRAPDVSFRPDVVVPVPLPFGRRFSRGFNQAADVARVVATEFGVPCRTRLVRRRAAPPQSGLSRAARRRNVRGAFSLWPWAKRFLQGRRVLVIDDVLTTGATVDAMCRVLRRARPSAIYVAAVARATAS